MRAKFEGERRHLRQGAGRKARNLPLAKVKTHASLGVRGKFTHQLVGTLKDMNVYANLGLGAKAAERNAVQHTGGRPVLN